MVRVVVVVDVGVGRGGEGEKVGERLGFDAEEVHVNVEDATHGVFVVAFDGGLQKVGVVV